jgi:hypothetical protein
MKDRNRPGAEVRVCGRNTGWPGPLAENYVGTYVSRIERELLPKYTLST